jgi:hypothetical protein
MLKTARYYSKTCWNVAKEIADRAVGRQAALMGDRRGNTLDPALVPWPAVVDAWDAQRDARVRRKAWIDRSIGGGKKEGPQKTVERDEEVEPETLDEVLERIKLDPELEPHEQRLLGCIVDAGRSQSSL